MFKKIKEELKDAKQIELISFVASIVSILGISLLTALTYIQNFIQGKSLFAISLHSLFTAILILAVSIIVGLVYMAINTSKNGHPLYFFVAIIVCGLVGLSLILMVVAFYIEIMNIPVVG